MPCYTITVLSLHVHEIQYVQVKIKATAFPYHCIYNVGCLICEREDSTIKRYLSEYDKEEEEEIASSGWISVFTRGFYHLDMVNIRNVRQHSGSLMITLADIDDG